MNAHDKYWWIIEHPEFINKDLVPVMIEMEPHMVSPDTLRIESYRPLNTQLQLWVEFLTPYLEDGSSNYVQAHDWELDCGGSSWEEAINNLYDLVLKKYGSYTQEDVDKKVSQVHKITRSTITAKSRKLKIRWSLVDGNTNWHKDILRPEVRVVYEEEMEQTKNTINALTKYRTTCNIDEYDAVDAELEKENFILFEQQISLQTGIDLVRQ